MIEKKTSRGLIVYGSTPEKFNKELDTKVKELEGQGYSVQLQFVPQTEGFAAFVQTEALLRIAQDLEDEMELKGVSATCGECPFYKPSTDGRVRYTYCDCGDRVSVKTRACPIFLQILKTARTVPERR